MTTTFTPHSVLKKRRHQLIAGVLLATFATVSTSFLFTPDQTSATTTTTWRGADLSEGAMIDTRYNATNNDISLRVSTSVSDSTRNDFILGENLSEPFAMTAFLEEGGVVINEGYVYIYDSEPRFIESVPYHSFKDGDLLYVSTFAGLSVLDTEGTLDPSDDILVTRYHTGSTPALVSNPVSHAFKDGDLLYISHRDSGGLSVIDTKGTVSAADDTLVTRYHTGSVPVIGNNRVLHSFLENNLLYVSTRGGGLSVINTQGTLSAADDTLVTRYHTGSMPALAHDTVYHTLLNNNLLYLSTANGLSVINTQGTLDPSDDTLVTRYHTGSTPALESDFVRQVFISNSILYIAGNGLSVINTEGTLDPGDDTLVTRYHTGSTPSLASSNVRSFFIDNNLLYLSTYGGGLHTINTQGTLDPSDDTLVKRYHTRSSPALVSDAIYDTIKSNGNFYVGTDLGLSVITPDTYRPAGTYLSTARAIATTPTTTLAATWSGSAATDVNLSYRTGPNDAVWLEEFDTADAYAGDYYGYGSDYEFQTIVATSGILQMTGEPIGYPDYAYFIIASGFVDDYFDPGSNILVRYRITNLPTEAGIGICTDDYESCSYSDVDPSDNDWQTISLRASDSFSNIGFDLYTDDGSDLDDTTLEIDYIQITTPDAMGHWDTWNLCPDQLCILPDLATSTWLQYKLDLETTDQSTTPVVHSVSYQGDYNESGTYTSRLETFRKPQELLIFNADLTLPASTTATFTYSLDQGTTWLPITPGASFPKNTIATTFLWRATLTTQNPAHTPRITSVSIDSTPHQSLQSTRQSTERAQSTQQIAALHDINSPEAVAVLEAQYPEYFENPDAPLARQKAMLVLLAEVVRLLKELAKLESAKGEG